MPFSEVYGSYFNVVAEILKEAVSGALTDRRLTEIIMEKAFAESVFSIPHALKSGEWPLLDEKLNTQLRHSPTMPLTILQKRWMKALLSDPRICLFSPSAEGFEDVEPLYKQDVFVFFDRYSDGDPYEDANYKAHFQVILRALREKQGLYIRFNDKDGERHSLTCIPLRLEYSAKDDKFRLIGASSKNAWIINLARIRCCKLLGAYGDSCRKNSEPKKKELVLELMDERNALERAMLNFSHLEKETERLDNGRYRITLKYEWEDETELIIRVLSFGPMLRAVSPEHFVNKIKERLSKQKSCCF